MAPVQTSDQVEGESTAVSAEALNDATESLVVEELLVEEVSIDGMCGVY